MIIIFNMHAMKIALLFAFIMFGVYAQYDAEQTVLSVLRDRNQLARENDVLETETIGEDGANHMSRAIELSHAGHRHGDGAPAGAVIVKDGVIIGEGWDKVKALNDPSAHAEVIAIREASKGSSTAKLQGSILYTTVQPCQMCRALINEIGIETVYYCIPAERVAEIHPEMKTKVRREEILPPGQAGRVREIPVMKESVSNLIESYRLSRNRPIL